jgi:cytochrome c oxidase subunit 4
MSHSSHHHPQAPQPGAPAASDVPAAHQHGEHHPHVVSLGLLVTVFVALLILTVITVAARYVDFGEFTLAVALAIAVVKATIVALYFMHLRWDSYFNSIAVISGFLFVALFIGIALTDTAEYAGNVNLYRATNPINPPARPLPPAPVTSPAAANPGSPPPAAAPAH